MSRAATLDREKLFQSRFQDSLPQILQLIRPEDLDAALAQPDLSGFLTKVASGVPAFSLDERLKEQQLNAIRFKHDLAEKAGGLLDVEDVMLLLGYKTRQAVYKAAGERRLLVVEDAGTNRYPACQFDDNAIRPGIPEILKAAPTTTGWRILQYLLRSEDGLAGRTPLSLIADGPEGIATAVRFAKRLES